MLGFAVALSAVGLGGCSSSPPGPGGNAGGSSLGPPYTGPAGAWVDRTPTPVPQVWPEAETANVDNEPMAMAYDAKRGCSVAFVDSKAGAATGTTLEWDGTEWKDATPPPPAPSPSERLAASMAYDASRGTEGRGNGMAVREP